MNNFGNGIMLPSDVPMLSGTWYNPQTGDHFTVRDCFIEDNNIKVMTTDGRMLDYNIIQRYIQSDKPIPKQEPPKKPAKKAAPKVNVAAGLNKSVSESIDDILTPEDKALLGEPINTLNEPINALDEPYMPTSKLTTCNTGPFKPELKNADIIAKGLKKAEKPTIDVKLIWNTFPEKELSALTEIMDIPVEDIVNWMTEEYFKFDDLKKSVGEYIRNVIENGYRDDRCEAIEIPSESDLEAPKKTPKSSTKKTTTKKK